jgi:hypothetical protein
MASITASTAATVRSGREEGRGTCGRSGGGGAPRCGCACEVGFSGGGAPSCGCEVGSRGERPASPLRLGLGSGSADAAAPLPTPPPAAAALVWVPLVFGSAADEEEDDAREDACGFCAAGAAGGAIDLGLA